MQLQSRFAALALVAGFGLFIGPVRRANALDPNLPPPRPIPSPTPSIVIAVSPTPTPLPTPSPPSVNPEGSIPVVITYQDGTDVRVQITRGLMNPAGIPFDKPVTVTLFLGSGIPGTPVRIGLYDGGKVTAVPLPGQDSVSVGDPGPPFPTVSAESTVRFNFQSGGPLGLYRVLLTIGPKQYLLQFYAVRPRAVPPLPGVTPTPPPHETPPPS
jgi:hypothetical protein